MERGRMRRLLLVLGALSAVSLLSSGPALAQGGLGGVLSSGGLGQTLEQATAPVTQATAPVVEQATLAGRRQPRLVAEVAVEHVGDVQQLVTQEGQCPLRRRQPGRREPHQQRGARGRGHQQISRLGGDGPGAPHDAAGAGGGDGARAAAGICSRAAARGPITMVFSNSSCCGSSTSPSTKRSAWWPTVITSPCCSACFLISLPLT